MESRVKVLGHATHPLLVALPIGLLSSALGFDLLRLGVSVSPAAGLDAPNSLLSSGRSICLHRADGVASDRQMLRPDSVVDSLNIDDL